MIKSSVQLLISTLLLSTSVFAVNQDDIKQCPNDGKAYKECKLARKNDKGASKYLLSEKGVLTRITDDNAEKCTIDQDVSDFKVSQHPKDAAVLYYVKKSSTNAGQKLVMVSNKDGDFNGQCLKVEKKDLLQNVKEFSVVSNSNTDVVNIALTNTGLLVAWDNNKVVYQDNGVVDYSMNSCYGAQGKSFSSYVLFSLDSAGIVEKVKGEAAGAYVKDAADQGRYDKISEFKKARNVCK